jgi:hypothetical protein
MARTPRRATRWLPAVLGMVVASLVQAPSPVAAQSPSPAHDYYAVAPGTSHRTLAHDGVVVEALGMDGCDSRRLPAQADIIYYIAHHEPVWLEVSPQSACASVATFTSEIQGMLNAINSGTADADEGLWFAGVMLDEEDGFGFTVSQLVSLNTAVQNAVATHPGHTFWSLQGFVANGGNANGCDWTNAQYDSVLLAGYQAQQIEHQCNINLVNHAAPRQALVTWSSGYTPGNTRANASNPVTAPPYHDNGKSYNWACHWVVT